MMVLTATPTSTASIDRIVELLGSEADALLTHTCKTIGKERL